MKIYDISQEVFGCCVYPGDPAPSREQISDISKGDICNLTAFSMCAHNGTHVDAPYHFYNEGKTVDSVPLYKLVGDAYVVSYDGVITAEAAKSILEKAKLAGAEKRLLFKGKSVVSLDAADVFARDGIYLIGNESQTVGPEEAPMDVHLKLLEKEVVLLEGKRLNDVEDGVYFLCAAPINLGGADGAPCRAMLIDFK